MIGFGFGDGLFLCVPQVIAPPLLADPLVDVDSGPRPPVHRWVVPFLVSIGTSAAFAMVLRSMLLGPQVGRSLCSHPGFDPLTKLVFLVAIGTPADSPMVLRSMPLDPQVRSHPGGFPVDYTLGRVPKTYLIQHVLESVAHAGDHVVVQFVQLIFRLWGVTPQGCAERFATKKCAECSMFVPTTGQSSS